MNRLYHFEGRSPCALSIADRSMRPMPGRPLHCAVGSIVVVISAASSLSTCATAGHRAGVLRSGQAGRLCPGLRAARRVLHPGDRRGAYRPDSQRNSDMATGAIEVFAHELTIINRAEPLPLTSTRSTAKGEPQIPLPGSASPRDGQVPEDPCQGQCLRAPLHGRARLLDIETPMLTKATPEGP